MKHDAKAKIQEFSDTLQAEFPGASIETQDGPDEKAMMAGPLTRTFVVDDGRKIRRVTVKHPFFADLSESPIGNLVAETAKLAAADLRSGIEHIAVDRQGATVIREPFA